MADDDNTFIALWFIFFVKSAAKRGSDSKNLEKICCDSCAADTFRASAISQISSVWRKRGYLIKDLILVLPVDEIGSSAEFASGIRGFRPHIIATRSALGYGGLFSRTALTALKITLFVPMPIAKTIIAITVAPGCLNLILAE